MRLIAYPGSLVRTLPNSRSKANSHPRPAVFHKDWAMLRLVGWMATIAVLALLIWQATAAEPFWPSAVSALLLVVISLIAGLRVGADSAAAYMTDLQRVNKVLADQNRELQESNLILLKQINAESATSPSNR